MSVGVRIQRLQRNLAGDRDDPNLLRHDLVVCWRTYDSPVQIRSFTILLFALVVLQRDCSSWRSSSSGTCISLAFMNFSEWVFISSVYTQNINMRVHCIGSPIKIPLSDLLVRLLLCTSWFWEVFRCIATDTSTILSVYWFWWSLDVLGLVLSGVFGLLVDLLRGDGFRFFCAIFLMIRDSSLTLLKTCSTRLPCDRRAAPLPCKIPGVCQHLVVVSHVLTRSLSSSGGRSSEVVLWNLLWATHGLPA